MKRPALIQILKEFQANKSGSFAVIAALLSFVIIVSAGAALDYGRIAHTKSKVNGALDSALLATGNNLALGIKDKDELEKDFLGFLSANLDGTGTYITELKVETFDVNVETGEIRATINAPVNATLTRIAGFDTVDVKITSAAIFEQTDTEVAMVLDVTGSMKGGKLRDLKLAAKDLIDIVLPKNQVSGVRIGLVPYANSVNVGKDYAPIVTDGNDHVKTASLSDFYDLSDNIPTNDCVTERAGREAATDASYEIAPLGSHYTTVDRNSRYRCPTTQIMPLTNKRDDLKKRVDQFVARGYTAGHIGISWGYYMLSENWRSLWKTANDPAPYSRNVRKIAILMTDGEFNTAYEEIDGNDPFGGNVDESNDAAVALCNNMKALKNGNPGILVYSIAFKAPKSAQKTLKACASDDTKTTQFYYSAANGDELRKAFKEIGKSIQSLRISG